MTPEVIRWSQHVCTCTYMCTHTRHVPPTPLQTLGLKKAKTSLGKFGWRRVDWSRFRDTESRVGDTKTKWARHGRRISSNRMTNTFQRWDTKSEVSEMYDCFFCLYKGNIDSKNTIKPWSKKENVRLIYTTGCFILRSNASGYTIMDGTKLVPSSLWALILQPRGLMFPAL